MLEGGEESDKGSKASRRRGEEKTLVLEKKGLVAFPPGLPASLLHLNLARNLIACLEGIETLVFLQSLKLYHNQLQSFQELYRLQGLRCLQDLDLRLNPLALRKGYRSRALETLPQIVILDERGVSTTFSITSPRSTQQSKYYDDVLDDIDTNVAEDRLLQMLLSDEVHEGIPADPTIATDETKGGVRAHTSVAKLDAAAQCDILSIAANSKLEERLRAAESEHRHLDAELQAWTARRGEEVEMLKEAHASLLSTNAQLVKELQLKDERHRQDAELWRRQFDEMKNLVDRSR
jgi:hypothetical protein